MNELKHVGFVYEIVIHGDAIPFVFKDEQSALTYAREKYMSLPYQIVPVPVFEFE